MSPCWGLSRRGKTSWKTSFPRLRARETVSDMRPSRVCSQLTESRSCRPDNSQLCADNAAGKGYQLRVDQWQQCEPFAERTVGSDTGGVLSSGASHPDTFYRHWPQVGTQKRSTSCFDESGALVSSSFCEDKPLPTNTRACVVAQDCVVSDWTNWEITQGGCVSAGGKVVS